MHLSLLVNSSPLPLPLSCTRWKLKQQGRLFSPGARILGGLNRSMGFNAPGTGNRNGVKAFFYNPAQDPIVKEALKEPVAFLGGMFAGILRLDLNEEPLKEWVTRTVEASGLSEEETNTEESATEAAPQEIKIE